MAGCSRRAMRPAAAMGAVYHAMLDAMLRDGWRDPAVRIKLSKGRKLWLALRYGADMSAERVHVVGAGLAGLAAAVSLAEAGRRVALYEAAPAGRRALPILSRCRRSAAASTTAITCCSPATARRCAIST